MVGRCKIQLDYECSCMINMESVSTVLHTTITAMGNGLRYKDKVYVKPGSVPRRKNQ